MITIKFTRTGVAGIGKRQLQAIGRAAVYAVGFYWWKNYLPIHFTRAALNRYKYAPRQGDPGGGRPFKGSYAELKVKRGTFINESIPAIGENKPFVWSGRSREQALGSSHVTATAKNHQTYEARVMIPANTLNFLRGRINADKEIRATTRVEEMKLEEVFGANFEAELNKVGRTQRTDKTIAA